eukprot:1871018-Pyramimonas_sp.AAC.1
MRETPSPGNSIATAGGQASMKAFAATETSSAFVDAGGEVRAIWWTTYRRHTSVTRGAIATD